MMNLNTFVSQAAPGAFINCGNNMAPFDGELYLIKQFYPLPEADQLFAALETGLAWHEEAIYIYGKWVKVLRLMCWYGDPDAYYHYSGVDHQPRPWNTVLQSVRIKVEKQLAWMEFNGIRAFVASMFLYSALLHTGYLLLAL